MDEGEFAAVVFRLETNVQVKRESEIHAQRSRQHRAAATSDESKYGTGNAHARDGSSTWRYGRRHGSGLARYRSSRSQDSI